MRRRRRFPRREPRQSRPWRGRSWRCARAWSTGCRGSRPNLGLARLDLERLKDGSTVSDGARLGIKTWLTGYSSSVEMNANIGDSQVERQPRVDDGLSPKEPALKVEQVERKVEQDKALLRARDQWIELIGQVKPEPEGTSELDEELSRGSRRIRRPAEGRGGSALGDHPARPGAQGDAGEARPAIHAGYRAQPHADHGRLPRAANWYGTLRDLVGFIDEQTLIDGMVEIEQTGILKEGPRRTELSNMEERRQKFELDKQQRLQVEPPVDVPDSPVFDVNICYGSSANWPAMSGKWPRSPRARKGRRPHRPATDRGAPDQRSRAQAGHRRRHAVQRDARRPGPGRHAPGGKAGGRGRAGPPERPTSGARLVDDLVGRVPILKGREGDWLLDDIWSVVAHTSISCRERRCPAT